MNSNKLYPWQNGVWQHLNHDPSRQAHALLFHGRAGIGKFEFAKHFSQSLLCVNKNATGHACGDCASCHWFKDDSHPDFRTLSPEQESETEEEGAPAKKTKKKTQISVAQIRELSGFLNLSSHRSGGVRVVLIHPAESLNIASANALLKMLEEPASGVIFILVAHQLQRLLPTIISRCQKVNMPIPSEAQALAWLNAQNIPNAKQQLAYSDGSPIRVFAEQSQFPQLTEVWKQLALGATLQPSTVAPMLQVNSVETGIMALQKWLYDLAAMRLAKQARYHLAQVNTLQVLADKVNLSALFQLQKKLDALRQLALHPLNHELQMETLLVDYTKLFVTK
ncbi:MAG TPA: DNA polymerase III subunit delta' [Methylotenera sp.]|nr:DNA polymerase III subunit delta' [Methylotenera sp.]HPH04443.1 DNA polymerase III subunit delta' [Methylotenera sp.]HPN01543.1 DNA polymerase III subunit delta' [Methylotenera sp.]